MGDLGIVVEKSLTVDFVKYVVEEICSRYFKISDVVDVVITLIMIKVIIMRLAIGSYGNFINDLKGAFGDFISEFKNKILKIHCE